MPIYGLVCGHCKEPSLVLVTRLQIVRACGLPDSAAIVQDAEEEWLQERAAKQIVASVQQNVDVQLIDGRTADPLCPSCGMPLDWRAIVRRNIINLACPRCGYRPGEPLEQLREG